MYADEDLIPISALQHHLFCPRQCALIHVDNLWAENRLTAEGQLLHQRSDKPGRRTRRTFSVDADSESPDLHKNAPAFTASAPITGLCVRTVRSLPLISRRLGLVGKADQVEFPVDVRGVLAGPPRPIEHKRGRPKRLDHDRAQLAAQAMCLEEMFDAGVPTGELFYHATRHRERVEIDDALRRLVEKITREVRSNIAANRVPAAEKQKKCKNCSLLNLCMPGGTGPGRNPGLYVARSLAISLREHLDSSSEALP